MHAPAATTGAAFIGFSAHLAERLRAAVSRQPAGRTASDETLAQPTDEPVTLLSPFVQCAVGREPGVRISLAEFMQLSERLLADPRRRRAYCPRCSARTVALPITSEVC